jgi:hypothetical protein
MAAYAVRGGLRPIPVVSLKTGMQSTYAQSIHSTVERLGLGLCLRISPEELRSTGAAEMIERLLSHYHAEAESVDLVIDRGAVDSGSIPYAEFAHRIPHVDVWRTVSVLAGSFPEDLSSLTSRKTHRLRRFEWQQWQELGSFSGHRPSFGDYAIQHVLFREPVAVPNFSASVRYTMENEYFVLRGEGVLNEDGPGYGQWNAWAALLVGMPEFFGATFSAGDEYIRERAEDWKRTGSAQTWLQAGFCHHLTTTALQVAGRLEQVRQITATASTADLAVIVGDQPEALA